MILDSVDSFWSYLSKSIIFPNFSPQFIVQFDQILKDLSKIPWFPVDSTLIYHYTLQFTLNSQIGKFGIIFDMRPCEIDDLAVLSRQEDTSRHERPRTRSYRAASTCPPSSRTPTVSTRSAYNVKRRSTSPSEMRCRCGRSLRWKSSIFRG